MGGAGERSLARWFLLFSLHVGFHSVKTGILDKNIKEKRTEIKEDDVKSSAITVAVEENIRAERLENDVTNIVRKGTSKNDTKERRTIIKLTDMKSNVKTETLGKSIMEERTEIMQDNQQSSVSIEKSIQDKTPVNKQIHLKLPLLDQETIGKLLTLNESNRKRGLESNKLDLDISVIEGGTVVIGKDSNENQFQALQKATNKPLICNYCFRTFVYQTSLNNHIENIHSGKILLKSSILEKTRGRKGDVSEMFVCSECGKVYQYIKSFMKHIAVHYVDKLSVKLHLPENALPFKCQHCELRFRTITRLKEHLSIHFRMRLLPCHQCSNMFRSEALLKEHAKTHNGVSKLLCEVCGKVYADIYILRRHMKIHNGVKEYTCYECPRSFTQKIGLVRHQRIHSREKPFSCSKCGKAFTWKNTLKDHMMEHEGGKRLHCDICSESFTRLWRLNFHRRKHLESLK
ncbi:hypothetical protein SK128_023081 [Halocaridina rubra]|uniref:C2H2-type domain-containing protein n=1 Tax=Halocaridina rubra TaxID=373956 RepID=A0AAN8X5J4_HALRR